MRLFRPILTLVFVINLSTLSSAYALDLYVDTKTKQIFAEPGPGRVHMGTYEKSESTSAKTGTPEKVLAAPSQAPAHEDRMAEVDDKAARERLIRLRDKAEKEQLKDQVSVLGERVKEVEKGYVVINC